MKDIILMAVYSIYLYNPSICLHVNGTFAHMPVTHAVCSAALSYHDRCLLLLLWLYLTPQHDGFLCNAIWGVKGQAHSPELSCLALHVLWFLWIPWIFSQYYVWYLVKDLNSLQFCIAKCDFWFVWHFSREIWHKVMSHDPALQRLRCSFYTQTWYLDLLPIHLLTVSSFKTV